MPAATPEPRRRPLPALVLGRLPPPGMAASRARAAGALPQAVAPGPAAYGRGQAVTTAGRRSAPSEARRLAANCAALAVAVEIQCQQEGYPADCGLAVAPRRAAASAFELAQEWTAEAEDRRR